MSRPVTIAPIHIAKESAATAFVPPLIAHSPDVASRASRKRLWIIAAKIAPTNIMAIFSRNSVLVTKTVACEVNRNAPDTALTRNPTQANFTTGRKLSIRISLNEPSKRRSNMANTPTNIANPTTCKLSTNGSPHSDSPTHNAIDVFSSHSNGSHYWYFLFSSIKLIRCQY